ncbi:MAG: hypothetical protein QM772_18190 [Ottowia sp.]|uniref:hypothetical protein n=1 Tax=Ottowia sp. TaxID=1898956 RepID=UPI0039E3CDA3
MRESRWARARIWAVYHGISALIHQPRLLRLIARTIQRQPWVGYAAGTVASRADVAAAFDRPLAFSSTAHRPNLVAGEFLIGLESGPRHTAERARLEARMPPPEDFGRCAADESRARSNTLLAGGGHAFDLIEDYMVPVAWQAMSGAFGAGLPRLEPGDPMFAHLRAIGAHLIIGRVATKAVQARARESAAALNGWVRANIAPLHAAWNAKGALSEEEVARNVVGVLWVGHPATVQSGALLVQEMLSRRADLWLRDLASDVRRHADPWSDADLRERVRLHVLELLRLRPPFPLLMRDVRRDTLYGTDGKGRAGGGSALTLLGVGAMSDPAAVPATPPCAFAPGRPLAFPEDRTLMFGRGGRQCVARDHVTETLVSAFIGLLRLPRLAWADPWWRRLRYDGPAIARLRLRFRAN